LALEQQQPHVPATPELEHHALQMLIRTNARFSSRFSAMTMVMPTVMPQVMDVKIVQHCETFARPPATIVTPHNFEKQRSALK
jgi:hypothetical protein